MADQISLGNLAFPGTGRSLDTIPKPELPLLQLLFLVADGEPNVPLGVEVTFNTTRTFDHYTAAAVAAWAAS